MTARREPTTDAEFAVPEGIGLVPLATARIIRAAGATPHRRIPSLYADPASWAVLEAVDELWAGCQEEVRQPRTTALVVVSTHGTLETMGGIARAVPSGRLSPLRFAGASAGGPISLVCLVHGLRGPTLMITTDPVDGWPTALTMTRHWLRTGAASAVVLAVHDHDPQRGHEVQCIVVKAAGLCPSGAAR